MGACSLNVEPWLQRYPFLAIVIGCAIASHAGGEPAKQKTFQIPPSFEEDRSDTSGSDTSEGYTWRSAGTAVSLSAGGELSIQSRTGGEARIRFMGASVRSRPRGEVPSESQTIYYLGEAKTWRAASHFERVRYSGIYRGIDLVFLAAGDRLEYNFEIAPYADPGVIRIHYEGSSFYLTPDGDLEIHAVNTVVTQRHPLAYQIVQGQKQSVACEYRWQEGHEIGLGLGAYDPVGPLFIDPVLDFSTYFGGNSFDSINAAATDPSGNLYVAGETSSGSLTNPSTAPRASRDAFIAKFSAAGALLFAVYLGGSAYDSGRGIALDALGNIYVTGVTNSSDFPVTNGALSTQAPGGGDAFVAKFNAGFVLQYATYLGGGGSDTGSAIAVDASGAAYISGQTNSTAFPVTPGAFQTSNHGGFSDCFVSKLNPAGNTLAYSMFLGGSALDLCEGIALDASGNAYVTGTTYSIDFPVTGALQSTLLGTANAFVAKVNAAGSALTYSTYLGGSSIDNAMAVAVDSSGEAYVTGDTASFDFPTTPAVFQSQLTGLYNAFVCKLSAAGNSLVYSTLIGGSGTDVGTSIAIDSSGWAIVGGYTTSFNFPTSQAIQTAFQGAFDAFSAVLDPGGTSLIFSSYFGGAGDDRGYAVAAAPAGVLYLAGVTSSSSFPVEFPIQAGLSVAPDAFILGITYDSLIPATMSSPTAGSTLSSSMVTFQWTAGTASQYGLWIGSSGVGSNNLAATGGTSTSYTATGLPTDGRALYVRLWSLVSGVWQYNDYIYTAYTASPATMSSPTNGSTLSSSTVTFQWTAGTASQYGLWIGSTGVGSNNLVATGGTSTSYMATGLPTDGRALYVRLWSLVSGVWQYNDYTYTAL